MNNILKGEHYCEAHQGNTSHYDPKNCTVCRLEAEVKRLREDGPHNFVRREMYEQMKERAETFKERLDTAETKLAAIEGVQRYKVTAVHLAIKAVTEERKFSDGDWIKYAEVRAILRGEDA